MGRGAERFRESDLCREDAGLYSEALLLEAEGITMFAINPLVETVDVAVMAGNEPGSSRKILGTARLLQIA